MRLTQLAAVLIAAFYLPTNGYAQLGAKPLTAPTAVVFPDKSLQVWVHQIWEIPWYNSPEFGAIYPLTLVPGPYSDTLKRRPGDSLQRQIDAGFTGLQVLCYDSGSAADRPEALMAEADHLSGLTIAPCLFVRGPDEVVKSVENYTLVAVKHPSAARMQGKLIVFTYGANYMLTPAEWQTVWERLRAENKDVFFVNDLATQGGIKGRFQQYYPVSDAVWNFGTREPAFYQAEADSNRLSAGGILPQYDRESVPNGGYDDAEGTAQYRRQWERSLAWDLNWNTVVSWNDVEERHYLLPDSEWNWTRADITAFYSARLRHAAFPPRLRLPQLYITTPQRVNIGQSRIGEALALNTGTRPVRVRVVLIDGASRAVTPATSSTVSGGQAGAAVASVAPAVMPPGHFLRVRATLIGSTGKLLQQVTSAPILVYGEGESTGDVQYTRVHYYSVPARLSLPGTVHVLLSGSPLGNGATATVVPPSGAIVRFAEVLQNTYQVENFFNSAPFTAPIPMVNGLMRIGAGANQTDPSGFYVARVIDEQERVGYSDPVYIAPPRNLVQNPSFENRLSGWDVQGSASVAATDGTGFAHGGQRYGQCSESASVTQAIRGMRDGMYTLRLWVKSNADHAGVFLVKGFGGTALTASIPKTGDTAAGSWWRTAEIQNIAVRSGRCTIGIYFYGKGSQFVQFDDIELYPQPDTHGKN